jgi:TolA-binding protein
MQPGQAGKQAQQAQRMAQQAQQIAQQARFAQQQAQWGLQAHQRSQQRRRKRRTQSPSTVVPAAGLSPRAQARKPARRFAKWMVAVAIIFWAVSIASHAEWVRLHDGPIKPVPYSLGVVLSVLAAALLLLAYARPDQHSKTAVGARGAGIASAPAGAAQIQVPTAQPAGPSPAVPAGATAGRRAANGAETPSYVAQNVEQTASGAGPALLVLSGQRPGRRIPIPSAGLVLGRDDQFGPPLSTDALISRRHASVRFLGDDLVELADLGSTNGTYVNAAQIAAPTRMKAGDVIRLGHVDLRLELAQHGGPARQDTIVGTRGAVAAPGPGADALLASARDLYEQRRYDEARHAFLELAEIPSTAAEAQYGLGLISLSLGDPGAAEPHLQQAVALDPAHANALYELGTLREQSQQIPDALSYYRRAVAASPGHVSALAALGRLGGNTGPPVQPPAPIVSAHNLPAGIVQPSAAGLSADNLPSVYQFLLEDPTPISQQTVQLIRRVECATRPRYLAYVGRYFARTLGTTVILGAALVVINVALNLLRDHSSSSVPAAATVSRISAILGVCIALLPLCVAVIGYVCVSCTYIRIQKGRLQIEKGVFRKHLNNIDFWRVHNIDLDRRLINRLTGDGTLVFSLTFGIVPENYQRRRKRTKPDHVIEVCGIAQDAELVELHQDLLNLTFLLRGNPIVKGIIQ